MSDELDFNDWKPGFFADDEVQIFDEERYQRALDWFENTSPIMRSNFLLTQRRSSRWNTEWSMRFYPWKDPEDE